jgi:hypothetical protein
MALLRNGHSTTILFGVLDPGFPLTLVEKTLTPIGWDGGGMIDITNMRNVLVRTRISKSLVTLTEMTVNVQWDPASFVPMVVPIQLNQPITIAYPDTSTILFYGWLDTFKPQEHKEGEEPIAAMTIIPSNINSLTGAEALPVYTP